MESPANNANVNADAIELVDHAELLASVSDDDLIAELEANPIATIDRYFSPGTSEITTCRISLFEIPLEPLQVLYERLKERTPRDLRAAYHVMRSTEQATAVSSISSRLGDDYDPQAAGAMLATTCILLAADFILNGAEDGFYTPAQIELARNARELFR